MTICSWAPVTSGIVLMEAALPVEKITAKVLGIGCGCSMADDETTEQEIEEFDRRSRELVFGKVFKSHGDVPASK